MIHKVCRKVKLNDLIEVNIAVNFFTNSNEKPEHPSEAALFECIVPISMHWT
jgi:hypothetical protein